MFLLAFECHQLFSQVCGARLWASTELSCEFTFSIELPRHGHLHRLQLFIRVDVLRTCLLDLFLYKASRIVTQLLHFNFVVVRGKLVRVRFASGVRSKVKSDMLLHGAMLSLVTSHHLIVLSKYFLDESVFGSLTMGYSRCGHSALYFLLINTILLS